MLPCKAATWLNLFSGRDAYVLKNHVVQRHATLLQSAACVQFTCSTPSSKGFVERNSNARDDNMKTGIVLAAFGSSSVQGTSALRGFEALTRHMFPQAPIRWAFTSHVMRERLAGEWKKSDSVAKALQKMAFEHFTHVAVQPLHVVHGLEYEELCEETHMVAKHFTALRVGEPLLQSTAHCAETAAALHTCLPEKRQPDEAVLFMGHGSRHEGSTRLYTALADAVQQHDPLLFIGTMKGEIRLEHLLPSLRLHSVRRVWLMPLLALVGRHALEDMAGDAPSSWRSRLQDEGMECEPVLQGLVEYPALARLWSERLREAMSALSVGMECV